MIFEDDLKALLYERLPRSGLSVVFNVGPLTKDDVKFVRANKPTSMLERRLHGRLPLYVRDAHVVRIGESFARIAVSPNIDAIAYVRVGKKNWQLLPGEVLDLTIRPASGAFEGTKKRTRKRD